MKITLRSFDLAEVHQILDAIGCSQDPVTYRGQETTIDHLSIILDSHRKASGISISFYSGGKGLVKGTVQAMVVDRLRKQRWS